MKNWMDTTKGVTHSRLQQVDADAMPPSSSEQAQERTSAAPMSLSSLSTALGLSSVSDHSGTHKRKESFLGEAFVSTFDAASIDEASMSSEAGTKSNQQEAPLSPLGEHDSATETGSSSGFLSLVVSGSSLSSNRSGPHLALTVSGASDALRELKNGFQETGQETGQENAAEGVEQEYTESPPQMVLLENVEYVTSLPHASSCTDLSTLDEPISKEMASDVFSRRKVPKEIPATRKNPSDVSTLCGGKHQAPHSKDGALELDVEEGQTQATTATEVQVTFPWHQRYLGQRSNIELFFLGVICISTTTLIVLLIIVLT